MSHAWLRSTFALLLSLGLAAPTFAEGEGKGKGPADGQAGAAKGPRDGQGPAGKGPRDGKPGDGKPGDGKPGDGKPGQGKPGEGRGMMTPERKAELMKRFDKNGDGQLDDNEKAAARAEFEKMRAARGEGKPGEGKPGLGKPGEGRGAEFMKRFDKNGDGKLDDAEKAAAKAAIGNRGPGGKGGPGPKPNGDKPGPKPEKN